ncbi:MAG TPA: chemotaxis-specific protein-glutamate methyltransferase CheB, partial [Acetobacteraceae bacterium]|nr:chemotaxis-specific protein-glutamate methyltransferase CheB [Acetobacteraceae bacterium]
MIKLLIVDDSALVRKLLTGIFGEQADFEVRQARDGIEALAMLGDYAPDVVTLDVHMPRMDGLTCLDRIMIEHPCPVVMVSTLTAEAADATLEALHLGAVDFIAKPAGPISMDIHEIAPMLVEKVRAAAGARLRPSLRLRERVRHRVGSVAPRPRRSALSVAPFSGPNRATDVLAGDGLVLIGVSTGGPPALETLLTRLHADFPWPILIAQHMPASFTGPLAKRLDGLSALTVTEVRQTATLNPGHVYIGRGDADLIVTTRRGRLVAMAAPSNPEFPWHPSADRLVRSAMDHLPASQIIGVLLTGMGSDGAAAMADLHAHGGRTIAEAEETAVVWGMPGEL